MKKILAIVISLISVNCLANEPASIPISEEHYSSPGIQDAQFKETSTSRRLSQAEIDVDREMNKSDKLSEKKTLMVIKEVTAKTNNATGHVNDYVKIYADQSACFRNTTNQMMQYGYRFDLQVFGENRLDARTYFLSPGFEECRYRSGFMTFTPGVTGNFTIVALSRGTEGYDWKEDRSYATLTVY